MAISGSFSSIPDHERITKALALIDVCKDKSEIVIEIEKVLRED